MRCAVPSSTAGSGTFAGVGTLCTGTAGLAGASVVVGAFGRACGGALGWVWAQAGAAINMAATSVDGTTRTNMLAPPRIAVSHQDFPDLSLRIAPTIVGSTIVGPIIIAVRLPGACRTSFERSPASPRAMTLVGAGQDKVHGPTNANGGGTPPATQSLNDGRPIDKPAHAGLPFHPCAYRTKSLACSVMVCGM